jgi:hypothetical protein
MRPVDGRDVSQRRDTSYGYSTVQTDIRWTPKRVGQ